MILTLSQHLTHCYSLSVPVLQLLLRLRPLSPGHHQRQRNQPRPGQAPGQDGGRVHLRVRELECGDHQDGEEGGPGHGRGDGRIPDHQSQLWLQPLSDCVGGRELQGQAQQARHSGKSLRLPSESSQSDISA